VRRYSLLFSCVLLPAAIAVAQDVNIQAELLSPVGTETSRKGDPISARVLSPAGMQGAVLGGKITESKSGQKLGGRSVLSFAFDTLSSGGQSVSISSEVRSVANSKGRLNTDDEGRVIRSSNGNVAKLAGGSGAGALIGGLAGGGKGAAIGAAAGGVASLVLIEVACDGPNVKLEPGSKVNLVAKSRGGKPLTSFAANTAPAAPAPAAAPVVAAAAAPVAQPAAVAAPATTVPPAGAEQPELTTLKSDFVPGEKTIFYDDFTDMTAGEAPPHFKVRGAAPELKAGGTLRQLTVVAGGSLFPNITGLPANFTFEAETKYEVPRGNVKTFMVLSSKTREAFLLYTTVSTESLDLVISKRDPYEELGRKRIKSDWNQPIKFALWMQNGRVRVFVNGEKQLDANQVELKPIDKVEMRTELAGVGTSMGYRTVRFAESTPDFSQMISSGRYVTHGILFDTDSDRIKPESAPVIQSIAKGLETNPNLKLLIEGYTDSVGNADHNLDLSKRRAAAVKTVLVAQFKVDAARLNTAGLGAAKPIDSNDTPQGRAQNRRVEFVKQ
jgi:OmpA-OmpF porin, OOP family